MKARLIGATVLVVLAVVLVPELLSGPKSAADGSASADAKRGMRTYTIDLGSTVNGAAGLEPAATETSAARSAPTPLPTVSPPGDRAAPATANGVAPEPAANVAVDTPETPATATPAASTGKAASTPTKIASASVPATTARASTGSIATSTTTSPSATSPAAKGTWAVQVGAFSSASSAHKLVADLGKNGFTAYVAPLNRSGKTLYRVRVGPASSKPDAEKLAARLKSRGTTGSVVPAG